MKLRKAITRSGPAGNFSGFVEVEKDADMYTVRYYLEFTPVYAITVAFWQVETHCAECEAILTSKLERLAKVPQVPLAEKLKSKGYV